MTATMKLFLVGLRQVFRDGMLLLLLPAPFLMGAALRILLPLADGILTREFAFSLIPWYPLSDTMLLTMSPLMTAMISAFLILDERDEGVGIYYNITPAGGRAYLLARLGYPMVWGFISSLLAIALFGLAIDNIPVILTVTLIATLLGMIACMILVALAANKVEGLALSKLTNILALGLPAAWFLPVTHKYLFAFLPSFWIGEVVYRSGADLSTVLLLGFGGLVCSVIWIGVLLNIFLKRAI